MVERFDEPIPDRNNQPDLSVRSSVTRDPASAGSDQQFALPQDGKGQVDREVPVSIAGPIAKKSPRVPMKGLISALVSIALFPTAILFVLLWQDMMRPQRGHAVPAAEGSSAARLPASKVSAQPERHPSALEVALSSPGRIEAKAGEVIAFPIAIDATAALPARSIVAITALPEGASFSEGRPYGVTGWNLRPNEIGDLRLRLPGRSGASDMRLELIAGDGTVLSQSETRVSIAPSPAEVATAAAIENASSEQVASVEHTGSVGDLVPLPQRKPSSSATNEPAVKVNTVKVVTVKPPRETRRHDGAYALGDAPTEPEAPAEWMETKTAVDMHAKAEQSSETVKVAEGGVKMRVTARDKNWVQVTDPATSAAGWIYKAFLKPAEPPAQ